MKKFFNKRFYPQNFIMEKTGITDSIIEKLSHEAACLTPDFFDAEVQYFNFILHYQPPYSEFTELKRLQTEAIRHTRFKDEYHGFIAIDISEWHNHFDDEFFIVMLTFLNDMSDNWKYIFLVDNKNSITNALTAFEKNTPSIRIYNISTSNISVDSFAKRLIDESSNAHKKIFTSSARKLLQNVFGNRICTDDKIVADASKDISVYFYNEPRLTDSLITEYLSNEFTYLSSLMTREEKNILSDYIFEKGDKT